MVIQNHLFPGNKPFPFIPLNNHARVCLKSCYGGFISIEARQGLHYGRTENTEMEIEPRRGEIMVELKQIYLCNKKSYSTKSSRFCKP